MKTRVITIDRDANRSSAAHRAADVLNEGGLVAFPTETVYGIGVRADLSDAVTRLRELKSRPPEKPFTVHIASPADAEGFASPLSGVARRLMRKAWPGPLTLILPVDNPLTQPRMAGLDSYAVTAMYFENTTGKAGLLVGLRCPSDAFARAMLSATQGPVIAASANRAQRPPPLTADEVLTELDGKIDLLIDGGSTRYTKASTIVRVTGTSYEIVREGVYDKRIVDDFATFRILFVCTGNTCRSPMAGALARVMLAKKRGCPESELPSRGIEVSSAGTAGGGGGAADHAVAVMGRRKIDLSNHVSAGLTAEMIDRADEILVMTRSHRQSVLVMVPSAEDRVRLVLGDRDIDDPIGGSEEDYERCATALTQGISARLDEVII